MKAKIINKDSSDYGNEFKVRRINYDQIVINYSGKEGIKTFYNNEVELITESSIDEFLIKYPDFLKIRLNRGISISLYKILLQDIEKNFEENFKEMDILKDEYQVNKRGIWQKEILCVINSKFPCKINANGQNFKKKNFNIIINIIPMEEFLEICIFEVKKITKQIKEKEKLLSIYGKALHLMDTRFDSDIKLIEK